MRDRTPASATGGRPPDGLVRPYEQRDREAVREICRRTAYRNRGYQAVFSDGELFADYWTKYYTDYEPESAQVVEENGRVIGYLFGCVDEARHRHVMGRRIVPAILLRALWKTVTFRYDRKSRRMLWWLVTRGWREEPEFSVERFPSNYHINILSHGAAKSYHTVMSLNFLNHAEASGSTGIHTQVEEAAAGGPWRRMSLAYQRETGNAPPEQADEKLSTFRNYVLGEQKVMVNRVFATTIPRYREWLAWLSKKHHM